MHIFEDAYIYSLDTRVFAARSYNPTGELVGGTNLRSTNRARKRTTNPALNQAIRPLQIISGYTLPAYTMRAGGWLIKTMGLPEISAIAYAILYPL